jgi:hypothetical protein
MKMKLKQCGLGCANAVPMGSARHLRDQGRTCLIMESLTAKETVRLCKLERIIQKGKDTFVEVGNSLGEIRDSKMYRATFKTFNEYCKERWGFSRQNAYEMIVAAEVSHNLSGTPDKTNITAICQARPLAKLPTEQQPAAWVKAQDIAKKEGGPVAARHVEAAVAEVIMSTPEPEAVVVDGVTEAPKDSERISLLKSTWNKASKKEKAAFAAWINKNWTI